jgi:hypothetical protein
MVGRTIVGGLFMKELGTSVESALRKLNGLLQKRFGVEVQYLPLYSSASKEKNHTIETVKRNAGAPMIVAHNELIVPIRVDGVLTGATLVTEINGLEPKDLSQIRETIDLILTGVIAAERRIEILTITESIIKQDYSNVISFNSHARSGSRVVNH